MKADGSTIETRMGDDSGVKLSYCVVNTNGREHLRACVEAVRAQAPAGAEAELLVLDNASSDGSPALLAELASEVIGVEPETELAAAASATLRELAIGNARIVRAALAKGHAAGAPYDAIVINGSVPSVPDSLFDQLQEGGRLAAIIASSVQPRVWLYVKAGGAVSGMPHFDVGARSLPGFAPAPQFAF